MQHLKKCVTLLEERVKEESIDGAVLLMFKDGDLAEDVMAGNIKSTSLLFVLEYVILSVRHDPSIADIFLDKNE